MKSKFYSHFQIDVCSSEESYIEYISFSFIFVSLFNEIVCYEQTSDAGQITGAKM